MSYALVNVGLITLNALLWVFGREFPVGDLPAHRVGHRPRVHHYYGFRHGDRPIRARQEHIEEFQRQPRVTV